MIRCMGCMNEYDGAAAVCPVCGLEADYENNLSKHLACRTVLASQYLVGCVRERDNLFITYAGFDSKNDCPVVIREFYPRKVVRRVTGKSTVACRSFELQGDYDATLAKIVANGGKTAALYSEEPALGIVDCFEENATVYLICKERTPDGRSLDKLFDNSKRVTLPVALSIVEEMLEALERLHDEGLTHGGICPENIFIGNSGHITLRGSRFGVPDPVKADTALRAYYPYEAPEERDCGETGPWTDVYSAAAVIYRMVAGWDVPNGGAEDFTLLWHGVSDEVPVAARQAIAKALAPKAVSRTRTAGELFEQLVLAAKEPEMEDNKPKKKNKFLSSVFPVKGDPTGEVVRKLVLIASVITMIVSGAVLVNTYIIEPHQFKTDTVKTAQVITSGDTDNEEKAWESIRKKYPDVKFPEGMKAKYAELFTINGDIKGWLSIPAFEMNFPIVQAADNDSYLKHNFYGKWTKYGVPFVDYRNNIPLLDRNTVLYGHNMSYDDLIFGMLENYRTVDGFKQAPTIEFDTLYDDYTWKVYAAFVTNSEPQGDNGFVFNYLFTSLGDEAFTEYMQEIDRRKFYSTGVDILPTDKILTLSTCCYDFDEARLVIIARLVRPGESSEVDTSAAVANANPKYPQAWYDSHGLDNPYLG